MFPFIPGFDLGVNTVKLAEVCERIREYQPAHAQAYLRKVTEEVVEDLMADVHSNPASGGSAGSAASNPPMTSQEPASKQLLLSLEASAVLAMRMISTVATSTAALANMKEKLNSKKQQAITVRAGSLFQIVSDTDASQQCCMMNLLQLAKDQHNLKVICRLLPQPQQLAFTRACRAVQQFSSRSSVIPWQLLLPVFLPMAAVPITWGSVCCNPQCLQLPKPGDAAKKRQVRGICLEAAIRGPISWEAIGRTCMCMQACPFLAGHM